MKLLKEMCVINALVWMSAIESESILPGIMVIISVVSGLAVDTIEKEKARLARQRKIVQKIKNLRNAS